MICGNQIAIGAIAMSSFNAYRITELNSEILALKSKTDLLVDVSHVHEAHLHHLEEKTDATNKLLADLLNQTSGSPPRSPTPSKRSSSPLCITTKTWSNRPSITYWLQGHFHTTFWMKSWTTHCPWRGKWTWSTLSTMLRTSSRWRFLTYMNPRHRNSDSSSTSLLCPTQTCSSFTSFCRLQSTSTSQQMSQSHLTSGWITCWPLDTPNLIELTPALICTRAFTLVTPSFAREGKWWRKVWKSLV